MYLNAPSIATPELDGKNAIEMETIGRRPYVCTNDLVRMDADGKLTFLINGWDAMILKRLNCRR